MSLAWGSSNVVSDSQIKDFIADSKVLDSDREKVILKICKDKIDKSVENLIKLLIENKRLLVLPEIASFFEELKDANEGVVEAHIIMAEEPSKKTVDDLIQREIEKINKNLSKIEKIKKYFIIKNQFTIENNMMTPTLKLKRYKIIKTYQNELEKLFN